MSDIDNADMVGCFGAFMYFLVCLPMWFVVLFHILSNINAEPWAWALYWVYVPTQFVTLGIIQAGKAMKGA